MMENSGNRFWLDKFVWLVFFTGPIPLLGLRPLVNLFLVDLFAILAGGAFLLNIIFNKDKEARVSGLLMVSVFLMVFGFSLSSVFSERPENYFLAMAQYVTVFIILIFTNYAVQGKRQAFSLIAAYFYGFSVAMFFSIIMYFDFISISHIKSEVAGRFAGVWWNPNTMAKQINAFLCVSLVGYFFMLKAYRKILFMPFFLIVVMASLFLIAASASFGGVFFLFLSLLGLLAIVLFGRGGKTRVAVVSILVLACFFVALVASSESYQEFLPEIFVKRVLSAGSVGEMGSAGDKGNQIAYGLSLFMKSPFVGVGLESGQFYNLPGMEMNRGDPISFHSFYVSVLVEGGIITAAGFFLLFCFFYRNALIAGELKILFLVVLCVFIINLIINNNIYTRFIWFPVAILAARFPRARC